MSDWSLSQLLSDLHLDIERRLATARLSFGHPVAKGDASEGVWIELLQTYLPERYRVQKAFVVDSLGQFSQQLDVVVFDRQYSPFIFKFQGQIIIPAESVYAVFEAKQAISATQVEYAQTKIASVRRLHRTSLPVPHVAGTSPPKPLLHIIGGLLTFESEWNPAFGEPFEKALSCDAPGRIDLGCVAAHGTFGCEANGSYTVTPEGKPATAFLFELIARLQANATVPMIDVREYARWLSN